MTLDDRSNRYRGGAKKSMSMMLRPRLANSGQDYYDHYLYNLLRKLFLAYGSVLWTRRQIVSCLGIGTESISNTVIGQLIIFSDPPFVKAKPASESVLSGLKL